MMSASESARGVWRTLSLEGGSAELSVPTIALDLDAGHGPVRLATSEAGQPRLLVPIGEPRRLDDALSGHGVDVRITRLVVRGRTCAFIDVTCLNASLEDVFLSLLDDVLRRLRGGSGAEEAVGAAIAEHRDLLRRAAGHTLEFLTGLFAELSVLEQLLSLSADAARNWTGPLPQRHDFSGSGACLEVKGTLSRTKAIVRISALDQLDPPRDGRPLYLAFLALERAGSAGRSVRDLIGVVRGRASDPAALDHALRRLEIADWQNSAALAAERFEISRQMLFSVVPGFPRISIDSFVGAHVPPGVTGITYDVDLKHAAAYGVAESEAPRVLAAVAAV